MSDNTNLEGDPPEDNDVIRGLREQLNAANRAAKTAGADAVAKVKRTQTASTLMPEGFKGLADVFESEVDGDLTEATAAEWLKGRGFGATSDELGEKAGEKAAELEAVTNLGSAVAAAGNLIPEDSITSALKELEESGKHKSITELSEAVSNILNGQ